MQKVMIVGAGKGGKLILKLLLEANFLHGGSIIDQNKNAQGLELVHSCDSQC